MPNEKIVAIITSGYFPIPAVLGGAVETLDENLIRQNEVEKKIKLIVFSCYDNMAAQKAKKYKYTTLKFVMIPSFVRRIDKMIYYIAKNVFHKKKSMSYRYIMQRLYYINKVSKDLYENDYDKIILENHATLFLTLKRYNNYKKYRGKYYYHLHNVVTNSYGCKNIIANCKKVIGVSNYINGTLNKFLGDKDNNCYCVLKNMIDRSVFAVDVSQIEKKRIRTKFGLTDDDIVILFSGRFNPEKGIEELLLALKKISNKKVKLLVVGGYYFGSGMVSSFEQEMYKLAEKIKNRVKFTGFISYDQMPMVYAIADIAVIPSIWDDPAPLTVIESLTSGKALITTNSGGIPEYADSESSIILQRDKNLVTNMAGAIEELADNHEKRLRLSKAAQIKTSKWDIENYYNEFCKILDN
jgi:glycosyltransferase involved in cell wall biosynthesis